MLGHNLKYELKATLRDKSLLFWLILFPIILGTLFKLAFGGIYEKTTVFDPIPTAVVYRQDNMMFKQVLGMMGGEDGMLKVTEADEAEAMKLLDDKKVSGIIFVEEEPALFVKEEGMDQSILKSFLDQYLHEEAIITNAVQEDPSKAMVIITSLFDQSELVKEIPMTQGNTDNMVQYFYNLIAMVAMYGSLMGINISTENQANLSALGARKCCSPTPKLIGISASLFSKLILQTGCMVICVTFLRFVLQVDLGDKLPLIYCAAILGGFVGVAFGFFISSFGSMGEGAKVGIALSFSMLMCFFSGLMVGQMKQIVARVAPWFNDINPAAVVSDSIYCLNIYPGYDRFIVKMITMAVTAVIFTALGFFMTRRRKYASL